MSVTEDPAALTELLPAAPSVLSQASSENFPVAMRLLGKDNRRHLMAIYGFARLVDDVGDLAAGDRTELLDGIQAELRRLFAGGSPGHPLLVELARTVRERALPVEPFERLIEANRLDQVRARYDTFEDLLGYCQLSAAPVGELVLRVFGVETPARIALSDLVCAGLQVLEHLQDVREDYARGRIYLPREDLSRHGCEEVDLDRAPSPAAVRKLVECEVSRANALLAAGGPLCRQLRGLARVAVGAFVAGGRASLRALAAEGFDVSGPPPPARRGTFLAALTQAVCGR